LADAKFCRFGDNMREVAVTEGDKVSAQIQFGYSVNGYGVGDLGEARQRSSRRKLKRSVNEYEARYEISPKLRKAANAGKSLREAARIEARFARVFDAGNFKGFTDDV
jgi:L-arabinose isomerase